MIKRILVGLGELAHSRSAAAKGVELARAHGAELTGVTLFDPDRLDDSGPVPIGGGAYAKELEESRLKAAAEGIAVATEAFLSCCEKAGLASRVIHEKGDPLTQLAAHARYHDLIVCGLHGLFEHGVINEPSDLIAKIVQAGIRPIVAVTAEDRPVKRVLIAYSGSMESAKTMKRFAQLGLWRDASLRIVTFNDDPVLGNEHLADAAEYFHAHGLRPKVECVHADPQDHLMEYAGQVGADLIVMGNSAKSLILRRIFGETALHVMRNTNVPLFLAQ
ncbi:MAG: universal stress protein [Pirellulales bacterium]|nr:universal stress protein [Pirellulales bacterium]